MLTVLCFTVVNSESTQCANEVTFQVFSGSDHPVLCLLKRFCTSTKNSVMHHVLMYKMLRFCPKSRSQQDQMFVCLSIRLSVSCLS